MKEFELTLLTSGQIWGNSKEKQLDVLKKYGTKTAATDLVILTGAFMTDDRDITRNYSYEEITARVLDDSSLFGRTCKVYTQKINSKGYEIIDYLGNRKIDENSRTIAIRPVLILQNIGDEILNKATKGYNEVLEVDLGEYPQTVVNKDESEKLNLAYQNGLMKKTEKTYRIDPRGYENDWGNAYGPILEIQEYDEYEYQGEKYIHITVNHFCSKCLSSGEQRLFERTFWVKVEPVKWLLDLKNKILVSKKALIAGVAMNVLYKNYDFSKTNIKTFLDNYMFHDIFDTPSKRIDEKITEVDLEISKLKELREYLVGLQQENINEPRLVLNPKNNSAK